MDSGVNVVNLDQRLRDEAGGLPEAVEHVAQ